ncbi:DUF3168 domain-containing protein [Sphingomonas sp. RHCKR7]|uniref:tail completion protein gp17 n=1 Tax=Sphingomonas folli TaxID=2862497 RepID=UPI001CA48534|nr:DUF3168 domain-containing protein [Sphingomonas folli]MBW6528774.1 DUF3168 domain-containing protein [Sphingomonas folli]
MSAAEGASAALRAAALAALRGIGVTRVFDGTAPRAAVPYALLRELAATDWGCTTHDGRELRLGVTIRDEGESGARAERLAAAAEAALLALPPLAAAWQVVSVAPLRLALVAEAPARWAALVDVRVRMLRV